MSKRSQFEEMVAGVDLATVNSPTTKIAGNEVVVGVMGDNLRKIYHLRITGADKLKDSYQAIELCVAEHNLQYMKGNDQDDCCKTIIAKIEALEKELEHLIAKAKALDEIFWNTAKIDFPELLGKSIGVREGFALVLCKESHEEEAEKAMLRYLLSAMRA